jgi:hypothetical protein
MCKTITQFNHGWLPVNASYSINATGTGRLCPFCSTSDEDQQHFLSCTHQHVTNQWKEASVTIKSKLIAYDKNINRQLIQLIGHAVVHWRTTPNPTMPSFLHPTFHQLFQAQSNIGWNHIVNGRFSKKWRHHIQQDRELASNWITYTIKSIWFQLYTIWKTRCQKHHGTSQDEKMKRPLLLLTPKVHELYHQEANLTPSAKYMFETPVDELLNRPIPTIKAWVHKVTLRIKTTRDKAKLKRFQDKFKITKIHPFFQKGRIPTKQVKNNSHDNPNTKCFQPLLQTSSHTFGKINLLQLTMTSSHRD